MYKFGVVSNDITFEPNFIKICSAILKLLYANERRKRSYYALRTDNDVRKTKFNNRVGYLKRNAPNMHY